MLIEIRQPPICAGVTPDGWITWRPGPVEIRAYQAPGGHLTYEARAV